MFTGIMSACPAFLGLTVSDGSGLRRPAAGKIEGQSSAGVLLKSDLLIFCPSNFSVEVRLERPPVAVAAISGDVQNLRSVVVGLTDSASTSPFYVRLTHASSLNGTVGGRVDHELSSGAPRRSSAASKTSSHRGNRVAGFTDGNVLIIAVAISGVLFIVVYVGQRTARATNAHAAGTPLSLVLCLTCAGV